MTNYHHRHQSSSARGFTIRFEPGREFLDVAAMIGTENLGWKSARCDFTVINGEVSSENFLLHYQPRDAIVVAPAISGRDEHTLSDSPNVIPSPFFFSCAFQNGYTIVLEKKRLHNVGRMRSRRRLLRFEFET